MLFVPAHVLVNSEVKMEPLVSPEVKMLICLLFIKTGMLGYVNVGASGV